MVSGVNEQRSIRLSVLDEQLHFTPIGNCTIPVNHPVPKEGAFVEIRYLYAYRGGSLYQPQYLGERTDVLVTDCQIGQLKYKAEETAA